MNGSADTRRSTGIWPAPQTRWRESHRQRIVALAYRADGNGTVLVEDPLSVREEARPLAKLIEMLFNLGRPSRVLLLKLRVNVCRTSARLRMRTLPSRRMKASVSMHSRRVFFPSSTHSVGLGPDFKLRVYKTG